MKLPTLPKADLPRINAWVETLRGIAAILFIPCLCLYAIGLVYLMREFAIMGPESVRLKVVDWYGWALIGLIINIGLGSMWLQKRNMKFSGTTPGGAGFNIDVDDEEEDDEPRRRRHD